jgi:hypothetical protein
VLAVRADVAVEGFLFRLVGGVRIPPCGWR